MCVVAHADIMFDASLAAAPGLLLGGTFSSGALGAGRSVPRALAVTRRPYEACLWESGGGHAHQVPVDLCSGPAGKPLRDGVVGFDAFGLKLAASLKASLKASLAGIDDSDAFAF